MQNHKHCKNKKKHKKQRKKKPTGLRRQLRYKKLRVLHGISEGIWWGDARSLGGRFARGERDAASPALRRLSPTKIAGFKEGRSHPGTRDRCKWTDSSRREGIRAANPPGCARGAFTYRLVPELLSLWGGRRSSLCRPGVAPCFPTAPRAAKTTPNVGGGAPAASPSSLSGCQEG